MAFIKIKNTTYMKNILLLFCFILTIISCANLPQGSNIRTATIRSINGDTINFYGSKKKFILEKNTQVSIEEKIQYTILKNGTGNYLPIIRKL